MRKSFKLGVIIALISLGTLFSSGEKAQAATATCLNTHAGFCNAVGLTVGVTTTVNFNAMKTALEKFYRDHSDTLAWSYMTYKGGHWYWRCLNRDVIRFDNVTPPCNPNSWGAYGACTATCGGGVQYRYNDCGKKSPAHTCNTQPCCGSADRETYKKTAEVTSAQRCSSGDTVVNWALHLGLAAKNGIAWTWNCNDGTANSDQCLAYKSGGCADDAVADPSKPSYTTNDDACKFGSFNSVKLVKDTDGITDILKWKCGTGELTNRHIGDFFSPDITNGNQVTVDYYGPKTGGVDCECTPTYDYTCEATNTYTGSCNNNCGGTIEELYQAVKTDKSCFLGKRKTISRGEYSVATAGKHCVNQTVNCAPCGAQDSEGGSYHETAY